MNDLCVWQCLNSSHWTNQRVLQRKRYHCYNPSPILAIDESNWEGIQHSQAIDHEKQYH